MIGHPFRPYQLQKSGTLFREQRMEKSVLKINWLENDYFVEDGGQDQIHPFPRIAKTKLDTRIVRGIIKDKTLMKNAVLIVFTVIFMTGCSEQIELPVSDGEIARAAESGNLDLNNSSMQAWTKMPRWVSGRTPRCIGQRFITTRTST